MKQNRKYKCITSRQHYNGLWNYSSVLFLCLSVLGCYIRAFTVDDKVWSISACGPLAISQVEWSAVTQIWLCHFLIYSLIAPSIFHEKVEVPYSQGPLWSSRKLSSSLVSSAQPPDYRRRHHNDLFVAH